MTFCPVESDLDRMYRQADMREQKYKRIRDWLIGSGRVEDAILDAARSDGDWEAYVTKHDDGYAVIQLGLLAISPSKDFDTEYLMVLADRVWKGFVKQESDATLDRLIEAEWNNWSDE